MALKLNYTTKYGVQVEYWKITVISVDYTAKIAEINIEGWINLQTRLDGKKPLVTLGYSWERDEFPFDSDEPISERQIAYQLLKESKEEDGTPGMFSLAEDC